MQRRWLIACLTVTGLLRITDARAQFADTTLATGSDTKLFVSHLIDSPIETQPYGEGGATFASADFFNAFTLGAQGAYPINELAQVGARLSFSSISPEVGDGQSGLTDLDIFGRYQLMDDQQTQVSAVPYLSLPIGSEDIGHGRLDFGAFGAARHALENGVTLTGTLGLKFVEVKTFDFANDRESTERETSLYLGFGGIYPVNEKLDAVGEFVIQTKSDFSVLSIGGDYKLTGGRLRGALAIGLDDGAADLSVSAGYLVSLTK